MISRGGAGQILRQAQGNATVVYQKNSASGSTGQPDTSIGKKWHGIYASYTPQQRIEIGAYSIGESRIIMRIQY